ncbi:MAG: hypothetical protein HY675_15425 [Chloroflexi bacterium]|nr:hypothetical protein [Chloroflexota bacterium]
MLRAWHWPAVIVSPDCDIDKQPGNLILRFENGDKKDWDVGCPDLWRGSQPLPAGSTTELLIRCPEEPRQLALTNLRKRGCRLVLDVVEPPAF